jgi:hypothetical protein
MNILRRLQLVAHGEPSYVIELSSLEPAATKQEEDWAPHRFFDMPSYKITSRLCGLLSQRRSPCTRSSKIQQ